MCGILASVNLPFADSTLNLIRHRGPDGEGRLERSVGPHQLCLAHRRLAIVDRSPAGRQPMRLPGAGSTLIYNGEVYNHYALRTDLKGIAFQGHSDTETIAHALNSRGIHALSSFNGIFALAWFDADRDRLYLARDPFGVKPLYYWNRDNALVACSELKPIVQLVDPSLDEESLAELLRLRYLPSPDTMFRDVRKVRPGHVVEFNLSAAKITAREWYFAQPLPAFCTASYRTAITDYGRLFESAVERQLMSDVEIGVLLSGGVDSALVAAVAQRHSARPLSAFTVGFEMDDDADEIAEARATAKALGLRHESVRIGFDDFWQACRKCVEIVEEPLATTSIVPMHFLAELASRRVKVVLSGQGADEPLGGYGRYQSELLRAWVPAPLARIAASLGQQMGLRHERWLRGLRSLSQPSTIKRFLETYTVFSQPQITSLIGRGDSRSLRRLHQQYARLPAGSRSTVESMMLIDMRMNLADDLLLYTDKITMRHSLECRVPTLDLELVRFMESLPVDYRVRLGQGKRIHKRYAQRVLPASIVNRRKKGFQSPTRRWFRRQSELRDLLLSNHSVFSRHFDLSEVDKIIRLHASGLNCERQLFLLICITFWMEDMLGDRTSQTARAA